MSASRRQFLWKFLTAFVIAPGLSRCTFNVLPPVLKVLSPNGGEKLTPQASGVIRWKAFNVGLLRLEFSADNGKTWSKIAEDVPPETAFFEWKLPKVNSTECRIRISDQQEPTLQDESDAVFSIQPILKLIYPNGGEVINPYEKQTIRWEAAGAGDLLIELSSVESIVWIKIADKVSSESGFYELQLPPHNSDKCLIRVTDTSNPALQDQSDAFFTIRESYALRLSEHPELQQIGGFKIFEDVDFANFAVLATGANAFKVLSLTCTHAGCSVQWENIRFQCPCHGSAFDKNGCVLVGPALTPLRTYAYEWDVAQGLLVIFNRLQNGRC